MKEGNVKYDKMYFKLQLTLKMETDINERTEQVNVLQTDFDLYKKNFEESYISLQDEKDKKIKALTEQSAYDIKERDKKLEDLTL